MSERDVYTRARETTIVLDRMAWAMSVLAGQHSAVKDLQLSELFTLTAKLLRELIAEAHQ